MAERLVNKAPGPQVARIAAQTGDGPWNDSDGIEARMYRTVHDGWVA